MNRRSRLTFQIRKSPGKKRHVGDSVSGHTGIYFIDVAGAEMLSKEVKRLMSKDVHLRFCALKNTVKDELTASGYLDMLGPDIFYDTVDEALSDLVQQQLDPDICTGCATRIFKQCPPLSSLGRQSDSPALNSG